jgi:hypothetical protein
VWDGPIEPIRIVVPESGDEQSGIFRGDTVVIETAGFPNDWFVEIYSANNFLGESNFHTSCSDEDMDSEDDCGKRQGNGKEEISEYINDWILQGIDTPESEFGNLVCGTCPGVGPGFNNCQVPILPGGAVVNYFYFVANNGEMAIQVTDLFDDKLGPQLAESFVLLPGEAKFLNATTNPNRIFQTTTNIATVQAVGVLGDGTEITEPCRDSDSVTVVARKSGKGASKSKGKSKSKGGPKSKGAITGNQAPFQPPSQAQSANPSRTGNLRWGGGAKWLSRRPNGP